MAITRVSLVYLPVTTRKRYVMLSTTVTSRLLVFVPFCACAAWCTIVSMQCGRDGKRDWAWPGIA